MASTQQIKARIKTVRNTRQITKAMELVAASKMRRAQEATVASRDFTRTAQAILMRLRELTDVSKHPLFAQRQVKSRILIVVTSDRGLAGAYNSNVLRRMTKELQADRDAGIKTQVILIGKQAARFGSKIENLDVLGSYDHMPERPTLQDLQPILDEVKRAFVNEQAARANAGLKIGKYHLPRLYTSDPERAADPQSPIPNSQSTDAVDVLYTDFRSSVVQEVSMLRLLPAAFTEETVSADLGKAIFEPSPKAVLDQVAERLVDVQLWQAYLESQASEQSARMMAMKTASDNAGELIDDLTLAMNTARQAAITQELAEITGGAEAIK